MTTVNTRGAHTAAAITPNDSTEFSPMYDAIWVGTGGNVAIVDGEGNSVTIKMDNGGLFPCTVFQVLSTGTTASDIIGLRY